MKKSDKNKRVEEEGPQLKLLEGLNELVRRTLTDFVHAAGAEALAQVLEEERRALCGAKYSRDGAGRYRWGSALGELVLAGRRVQVPRPRVRDADGEVPLPSWEEFSKTDPLDERALTQMMVGVSTRNYERSLSSSPKEMKTRGATRSAVSRRFKAATQKRLGELLGRDLSELGIRVVMIDGIHIDEHVVLIAVGVDGEGRKHVLGLWEGATENYEVSVSLLSDLVERGLDAQCSTLFVIDGSKALRKAIRVVFGERAVVQRCQFHKRQNVKGHLPKELWRSTDKAMKDAYGSSSVKAAKKRLLAIAKGLESNHPSAARSLKEGLDETLTIKHMKLGKTLEQTLRTTNLIENLNSGVRQHTRRVKRWRDGSMIVRWVAAAVLEREKTFRRLRGHKDMPKLIAFLQQNDRRLNAGRTTVATEQAVA